MPIATRRNTKYTNLVRQVMLRAGHTTNAEIASILRREHPRLSDTTVHRVTARLISDGECTYGPVLQSGVRRFDVNVLPHDHFQCSSCGHLRDIILPISVRSQIESAVGGCTIDGQLMIVGNCHTCKV